MALDPQTERDMPRSESSDQLQAGKWRGRSEKRIEGLWLTMLVFENNLSGQSLSTDSGTIAPAVFHRLRIEYPSIKVVGIIAPMEWGLIQAWHACLDAGCTPIILHYPTPKLSKVYWSAEISAAITSSNIELLICDLRTSVPPGIDCPVIFINDCDIVNSSEPMFIPAAGSIIQMSSGTTGHRKGIQFSFKDVAKHIEAYNRVTLLSPNDCVVSWLPLYHDMGFVAAYLMPRLLGCKLVLLDPITWVRQPEVLFETIEQHGGTICYMPNFGFEVMATRGRKCANVRKWVSCSEPTRASTMQRFGDVVGAASTAIINCWGMAENIFAVSVSAGIQTYDFNGAEVVSCGSAIPGVDIKTVDDELYVRSEYSIKNYIGSEIKLDAEGYYPTGDLGRIIDGQVYLLGRKHDVINVAGRKTLASDVDFAAAQEMPESAGRIATFSIYDSGAGTDLPVILIEHPEFWIKNKDHDLQRRVTSRSGVEGARVYFVPPRFITKTSSGKINRKATRTDWIARLEDIAARGQKASKADSDSAWSEIRESFPWINPTIPVKDQIDSLGFVNLNIILTRHGLYGNIKPDQTLSEVLALERATQTGEEVLKIVSLTDANVFRPLGDSVLEAFKDPNGRALQFKHVCAPPPAVLLNDLIFYDYFFSRDPRGASAFPSFSGAIEDIKSASMLVVDEAATLVFPFSENKMVYPQLSHDFQATPAADTIALRWARYSEDYFLLPRTSKSYKPDERSLVNDQIELLGSYLGIPVVKVAYGTSDAVITGDWPVQGRAPTARTSVFFGSAEGLKLDEFTLDLSAALTEAALSAPSRSNNEGSYINWNDQPHWCSWHINPAMLEYIFDRYSDCVVLGKPSSAPILAKIALDRGVRIRYRYDLQVPEDCECIIIAGSWGQPQTDKPIFQLMAAGFGDGRPVNVSAETAEQCPPSRILD